MSERLGFRAHPLCIHRARHMFMLYCSAASGPGAGARRRYSPPPRRAPTAPGIRTVAFFIVSDNKTVPQKNNNNNNKNNCVLIRLSVPSMSASPSDDGACVSLFSGIVSDFRSPGPARRRRPRPGLDGGGS